MQNFRDTSLFSAGTSADSAQSFWDDLPKPFFVLAPMEGVTDKVFRAVVARAGAPDVFYTEFTNVSSFASEKGCANALERLEINPNEGLRDHDAAPNAGLRDRATAPNADLPASRTETGASQRGRLVPIVAQIWGKNPDQFALLASELEGLGFDGLDLNMGCPDKNVVKTGGGSGMIRTPDLAVECIRRAKAATTLPVSVKTRLGYSRVDESRTWLPTLLKENLAVLTVHLRTKKEMSKVDAHLELIPEILKLRDELAPATRIVINGDIENRATALALSEKYPSIDGFMIGRGVFKDIFCFQDSQKRVTRTGGAPVSRAGEHEMGARGSWQDPFLTELFLYHLDLFDARHAELEARGQKYPFEPLKHFYKVYFNSTPNSSELRQKLMDCKTTDELRSVIEKK